MGKKDDFTVLFIGLGSVGKRHLRILRRIAKIKALKVMRKGVDPGDESEDIRDVKVCYSIAHAVEKKPDFAIISTPSAYHLKPAMELIDARIPFIVEKPISHNLDGLDLLQEKAEKNNVPVLVGFQMRYHPAFDRIISWIKEGNIGRPLCLLGEVGQYLPDWRPLIDYRNNYSAHSNMGGGVILDLCHEIDIALKIMGPIQKVSCICGTYSDLEITSEDIALISSEHQGKVVSNLCLNYIERGYIWKTRIVGSKGTITWDYGSGFALLQTEGSRELQYEDPDGFHRDDLFLTQLKLWIEVVRGNAQPCVTLKEGIEAMKVCNAAHRSAAEAAHIFL